MHHRLSLIISTSRNRRSGSPAGMGGPCSSVQLVNHKYRSFEQLIDDSNILAASSLTVASVLAYFQTSLLILLSSFPFTPLRIFLVIILICCFVISILSHSIPLYYNLPLRDSIHTLYIYLSSVSPTVFMTLPFHRLPPLCTWCYYMCQCTSFRPRSTVRSVSGLLLHGVRSSRSLPGTVTLM